MSNGHNDWNVSYVYIVWLENLLNSHSNIRNVTRTNDIYFKVERINQNDTITILCLNEYSMGVTMVQRAISGFSPLNIIYVGGNWNNYTSEAYEYCSENSMGICNSTGILRMLWKYKLSE
ncbi:MAG: hypothetical protein GQ534_03085 [Candidatus Delongbacteria bacterium]|nr:hypothetical protein [Candidatus Delongbacteria bacterium]